MTTYRWHEIGDVPSEPGVYAWYYVPEVTAFDLDRVVTTVEALKAGGHLGEAKEALRAFLDTSIFQYFRERSYDASLSGPLKPRYRGLVEHVPTLSESLLDRLIEDTGRLAVIRTVLETSAPDFASPIYIGMSERLSTRLKQHKSLIEKYGEQDAGPSTENRDRSFAREIRMRKIPPQRLFVKVKVVPGAFVDIENILNRIHYPLLGRN
ncbi:hypothetical protein [Antrihabitans sp. YC2-6]|uniref:hypothetical protein n=1 Tax=Antrihabitans sp. YC2-6 TaxID=2799498 RepID=UPI0018F75A11|nr:hypothetical protein [Antrihabitans sp. YC2-6]MBJ8348842.1 hypothetical protein [Antrihabitans sp. YC2-6]